MTGFKPGDLVRLRSGGPVMTVEFLDTLEENDRGEYARCSWFNGYAQFNAAGAIVFTQWKSFTDLFYVAALEEV